jgi:ketol-acid reductoisomerase
MDSLYRQSDCPETPIRGWTLGILGYGNQGRAQAQNLRDSGYQVIVAVDDDRPSAGKARSDGFATVAPDKLPRSAELAAMLAPDEAHRELVERIAARAGSESRLRTLVFAHGFTLRFAPPDFPPGWDVVVVAPAGPGVQLRDRYLAGEGIPALLAVHRDASGGAGSIGRAYASAIGCARAGVLPTTVAEEVEVDLFGEQAVLCGGMNALAETAFDALVEAGYAEEMAYLECVHQLRLTAELVERFGVEGMRRRISTTALFGDLSRGRRIIGPEARREMQRILGEVRDGTFAREWRAARERDPGWVESALGRARNEREERAGEVIRGLFGGGVPRKKV